MYGLLITFETDASLAELEAPFTEYAGALCDQPGFISKAWLHDGNTLGGFHLFADKASADAYLGSEQAAGLMATEGFGNFQTQGFDVLEGLSALTGVTGARQPA